MPDPVDPNDNKGETVTISKEEWEQTKQQLSDVNKKLDFLEQQGPQYGQHAAAPATPAGPSLDEQITTIDKDIDTLEEQIDAAIKDEKPTKELRKQVSALVEKKVALRSDARFDDFAQRGLGMISQITDTVTGGQMPLLARVPSVKKEYDNLLKTLSPEQRANPASLKAIYNLACGTHIEDITAMQQEEWQRKVTDGEIQVQLPGQGAAGTQHYVPPEPPKIKETFGEGAVQALESVGNRDPNRVAQAFGFKDANEYVEFSGKIDEYEKTGKWQEGGQA